MEERGETPVQSKRSLSRQEDPVESFEAVEVVLSGLQERSGRRCSDDGENHLL